MNKKTQVEAPSRATRFFGDLAKRTSYEAGRAPAFLLAAAVVVIWALSGPLFNFSDTWELIINTGTTIVTFLMVFLIQNSQNRDSAAIQVKLDELIRVGAARNSLVGIEHLTVHEIEEIRKKNANPLRARRKPETKHSIGAASRRVTLLRKCLFDQPALGLRPLE